MQYAKNQNRVLLDLVEYPMAAVNQAANVLAEFRSRRTGLRVPTKQSERSSETPRIGIGDSAPKFFSAVIVYFRQIAARCWIEPDVSHAGRGVRR